MVRTRIITVLGLALMACCGENRNRDRHSMSERDTDVVSSAIQDTAEVWRQRASERRAIEDSIVRIDICQGRSGDFCDSLTALLDSLNQWNKLDAEMVERGSGDR